MASAVFDKNTLFYGDNLEVLRKHFPPECIDLIYLDPPFNSKADYNILFKEKSGKKSVAQAQAFSDSWTWDTVAEETYMEIQKDPNLGKMITFLHGYLGKNDMMAYLVMMTIRLQKLHEVLKSTGSIYLHCDPTSSHYLKIVMDGIFGVKNFRNEIVWKRTFAHGSANRWGDVHDVILFYSKSDSYTWTRLMQPHEVKYLKSKYRFEDERGRYRLVVLTGPGITSGVSGKPWRGYNPTGIGRHWAVPRGALAELRSQGVKIPEDLHKQLELLHERGYIRFAKKPDGSQGTPEYKLYLPKHGAPIQDVIFDISPINSQAQERLGYPTQKPIELLKRLIEASSNEGDLVLDPFCGCGTTIMAAQELKVKRRWIGIDVTHLAISLIRSRLKKIRVYAGKDYKIVGEPVDVASATKLAEDDKYQFQYWAVSLIDAFPVGQTSKSPYGKKGADKGIDGWLTFKEGASIDLKRIVIQAKGGHNVGAGEVRDLVGTVQNTKSAMGILITLDEPTQPMKIAAMEAGYYESPTWGHEYPKIQISTIPDLLEGKKPKIPR
jgi:site-specific DNA-methyltransferase (adenine-specific)